MSVQATRLAEVTAALRQLPAHLRAGGEREIAAALEGIKTVAQQRSTSGPLFKRSGRLRNSWSTKPRGKGGNVIVNRSVGSYGYVAYKHEFGFTEYGRPWIWIPTDANLRPNRANARVKPEAAREKILNGQWRYSSVARGDSQYSYLSSINGEAIRKTSASLVLNEQNQPMYLLTKRTHIPARLGFFQAGRLAQDPLVKRLADLAVEYWQTVV